MMNLKAPFREGETVEGTLTFEKAGTARVRFQVRGISAAMPKTSRKLVTLASRIVTPLGAGSGCAEWPALAVAVARVATVAVAAIRVAVAVAVAVA